MTHNFTATEQTFWVAHGPALHYGVLEAGESMSTGQEFFETFDRRLPWRARVIELGGDPDNNDDRTGDFTAVSEEPTE